MFLSNSSLFLTCIKIMKLTVPSVVYNDLMLFSPTHFSPFSRETHKQMFKLNASSMYKMIYLQNLLSCYFDATLLKPRIKSFYGIMTSFACLYFHCSIFMHSIKIIYKNRQMEMLFLRHDLWESIWTWYYVVQTPHKRNKAEIQPGIWSFCHTHFNINKLRWCYNSSFYVAGCVVCL